MILPFFPLSATPPVESIARWKSPVERLLMVMHNMMVMMMMRT